MFYVRYFTEKPEAGTTAKLTREKNILQRTISWPFKQLNAKYIHIRMSRAVKRKPCKRKRRMGITGNEMERGKKN